jgi:tRNA(fMet)-specific endonuclease VapC
VKTVQADTNILSYIFNKHSYANLYQRHLKGNIVLISSQTVAEMRFGALKRNWGVTRLAALESFLTNYITVYPNDVICSLWARVRVDAEFQGKHVSKDDAWIAATALAMDVPLITHSKQDFEFVQSLTVISEA